MIVFSEGPDDPHNHDDFSGWRHTLVRLMNAHLACLWTVVDAPYAWSSVVTVGDVLQVRFGDAHSMVASPGTQSATLAIQLFSARLMPEEERADWRFDRPSLLITGEQMEASFDLLGRLLDHAAPSDKNTAPLTRPALLHAELLHSARIALAEGDSSGALVNAWIACEALLGDLLARYLDEVSSRDGGVDESGNRCAFMGSSRRGFFERDASWSIRHTVELLSLLDIIPFALYRKVHQCAKARNNWLHVQQEPDRGVPQDAIRAAGHLFSLVYDVPFELIRDHSGLVPPA